MRNELAFVRWFPGVLGGRYVVAIVVSDPRGEDGTIRHWIVTAHVARRLGPWRVLWRVLWERATQR